MQLWYTSVGATADMMTGWPSGCCEDPADETSRLSNIDRSTVGDEISRCAMVNVRCHLVPGCLVPLSSPLDQQPFQEIVQEDQGCWSGLCEPDASGLAWVDVL